MGQRPDGGRAAPLFQKLPALRRGGPDERFPADGAGERPADGLRAGENLDRARREGTDHAQLCVGVHRAGERAEPLDKGDGGEAAGEPPQIAGGMRQHRAKPHREAGECAVEQVQLTAACVPVRPAWDFDGRSSARRGDEPVRRRYGGCVRLQARADPVHPRHAQLPDRAVPGRRVGGRATDPDCPG